MQHSVCLCKCEISCLMSVCVLELYYELLGHFNELWILHSSQLFWQALFHDHSLERLYVWETDLYIVQGGRLEDLSDELLLLLETQCAPVDKIWHIHTLCICACALYVQVFFKLVCSILWASLYFWTFSRRSSCSSLTYWSPENCPGWAGAQAASTHTGQQSPNTKSSTLAPSRAQTLFLVECAWFDDESVWRYAGWLLV